MARRRQQAVGRSVDPVVAKYGEVGKTYLENLRANTSNELVRRAVDTVTSPEPAPQETTDGGPRSS